MMRKFTTATVLSFAAVVALAGCSGSSAAPNDDSSAGTLDDSLSSVLESGTLTIGTEGTYRPFSYHADGSGDLTGYDVEVARAVADQLGVEAEFEETQWDAIFAGLEAGRFDTIANQVSITPEREESYVFSTPYTFSTGVIVVPEANTDITSFDDLAGKTTAQSLTSNWNALATESGATVQGVEGWAQSVALVEQGRVDATINDKLTYLDYKKQTGAAGLKIAAETEDRSESAFAFAKDGTALAEAVSDALATLSEDGTLASISDTYFGADVSQ
ncbi:amino acid ABC transporter substrate-binding protein [Cryobacterium sp.]|jgi:cystine transport system substrate-binding protein|uniref:amino acid ABC transporter substrate-binding protein n=1 Tax=Cryobacterium sp. TaxID=1926290 RepID=UPI0026187563|nr:amino acid ABC transporter substrate-binding protein [Cryobacterium sp.]MCU1447793.1 polar amino acid transporter substrate-binding protein [Cryobacterium sp.]